MKTLLTLALTTVTTVASSTALAAPPIRATAVLAPAPNPVQVDAPSPPVGKAPEPAGRGAFVTYGIGAAVLRGDAAEGVPLSAALATVELKLGVYVTRHLGFVAGAQGGYGPLTEGCAGKCTEGYAYKLPILAQFAFYDHVSGPYLEGGLALFPTYGGSTSKEVDVSPETLSASSPVDLHFGIGYRLGESFAKLGKGGAYDLRFTMDAGQFNKLQYSSVLGSVEGEIQDSRRSTHVLFNLAFNMQLGN